jgi:hypothetical protein
MGEPTRDDLDQPKRHDSGDRWLVVLAYSPLILLWGFTVAVMIYFIWIVLQRLW